jgi:nitronate monooxygenase
MGFSGRLPEIIQGGMGVGVSNWRLARAVASLGQLGVVSGSGLDAVFARRLQLGDSGGHIRRALTHFPWPEMVRRIFETYYVDGGKAPDAPFKSIPKSAFEMKAPFVELQIVANFAEMFLAKEGHAGLVGVNYLEKVQLAVLPSLLGAMLAGVDYVLMGGGIPLSIPGILDGLARLDPVELHLHVEDNPNGYDYIVRFDTPQWCAEGRPELKRPKFLAIVSSEIIAKTMLRRGNGRVDGFIIENHRAGGHNAPPRKSDATRNAPVPQYGAKDLADLAKVRGLGLPFWLAGACASPEKLAEAVAQGANGIQVGTAFAFCRESGILPAIKQQALRRCLDGDLEVQTDLQASPTGYPFKMLGLMEATSSGVATSPGSATEYTSQRVCDLGYLRQYYSKGESVLGYRCSGEPVEHYLRKGGLHERTLGKECLCNGLLATVGLGQIRDDGAVRPIVTAGEDLSFVEPLVARVGTDYTARDVIEYLIQEIGSLPITEGEAAGALN